MKHIQSFNLIVAETSGDIKTSCRRTKHQLQYCQNPSSNFPPRKKNFKKPKHIIETKKAVRRENHLAKVLTPARVNRALSYITSNKSKLNKKCKPFKEFKNLSEAQIVMNTRQV